MTMLVYGAFVVVALFLALHAIFFDLPDAAVSTARNNLFQLRARLFRVAAEGRVSFENRSYQMHRQLLNGLIRYSHDINVTNMMFSRALRGERETIRYSAVKKLMKADLKVLPDDVRESFKEISISAHTEMVLLMANRSVFITAFLRALWVSSVARSLLEGYLSHRNKQRAARKDNLGVAASPMLQKARKKMTPKIDRSAWAYVDEGAFCLPMAA